MKANADITQPDFLTVEQAAAVVGIGRTCAYQLARKAADLGEGTFPAVRFGKQLRVPRRKLEELTGGPIIIPAHADDTTPASATSHDRPGPTAVTTTADPLQPPLPLTE